MKASIKFAKNSKYTAWVTIVAFLVIGVTGSVGLVWCLESDGHLNLEHGPGCTRLALQTPPVSPVIVKEAPVKGQCLRCLDFPAFLPGLSSGDTRFNGPSEQISGLANSLFPTSLDVNLASRGIFPLGSSQSLLTIPLLRTVVLII
ncbi:MAG: hypothetical protein AB1733_01725 [Thermodesulfobacteriota bacterium]